MPIESMAFPCHGVSGPPCRIEVSTVEELLTVNTSILQGGPLTPWQGNAVLSIGMSRFFFR